MRDQVLQLLAKGRSSREVGLALGLGHRSVTGIARREGLTFGRGLPGGLDSMSRRRALELVVPVDPVDQGEWIDAQGRLRLEGRVAIQAWLFDEVSHAVIAARLGVHRSTVSRELTRSEPGQPYRAWDAHNDALQARARPKPSKLEDPWLRAEVIAGLNKRWSPEQIAADLQVRFPGRHDKQVSHETIYQALYVQGKGSLRAELEEEKATRTGRTRRKRRSALPPRGGRSWIGEATSISARPAEVADRAVPGHWEGDLVIGAGGANALITLAERTSRFTLIHRLPERHDAATVADALIQMMRTLPTSLRRTLTWDQGCEMSAHAEFTIATDCAVYFCDPHSPWQRGTNENTNGLVRDWYPKGTDFATVTDEQIQHVQDLLNTRPRKTLAWATPAATLAPLLDVAQTA